MYPPLGTITIVSCVKTLQIYLSANFKYKAQLACALGLQNLFTLICEILSLWPSPHAPSPQTPKTTISLFASINLTLLDVSYVIRCSVLLSMTGLLHFSPLLVTLLQMAGFSFFLEWIVFWYVCILLCCVYHICFNWSFITRNLVCFHNLVNVSNAAMNIELSISLKILIPFPLHI